MVPIATLLAACLRAAPRHWFGAALLFVFPYQVDHVCDDEFLGLRSADAPLPSPRFQLGEIALYGALLFHGINGVRILLVDFVLDRTHVSKKIFWMFAALIIVLLIVGTIPLLFHWNTGPFQPGVTGGN